MVLVVSGDVERVRRARNQTEVGRSWHAKRADCRGIT